MKLTPALLIILDGFGYREECDHNAICQARKPHWDSLWKSCPHTTIDASEKWVGLPAAQMGNSEVGHLNIGAGRVVYQDYTRIERAIESGEFFTNPVLAKAVDTARDGALHILGLLSPGGVHSHESQIHAMLEMAARAGVKNIYVHAFLDGRDTPPKSAEASLAALQEKCERSRRDALLPSADATTPWTATSAGSACSRLRSDHARQGRVPGSHRGRRPARRLRARRKG